MIKLLLGGYAVFTAALVGSACFVTLFDKSRPKREHGFKVLRLLWIPTTGGCGIAVAAIRLQELHMI